MDAPWGLSTFWFENRMDQNNETLKYLTEPFFPTDSRFEVNYKHNLNFIRKSMKLYFSERGKLITRISREMTTFWKSRLIWSKLTNISLNFKYPRWYFLINMRFIWHFCDFFINTGNLAISLLFIAQKAVKAQMIVKILKKCCLVQKKIIS